MKQERKSISNIDSVQSVKLSNEDVVLRENSSNGFYVSLQNEVALRRLPAPD